MGGSRSLRRRITRWMLLPRDDNKPVIDVAPAVITTFDQQWRRAVESMVANFGQLERDTAERRAEAMLASKLTPQQQDTWKRGYIEVVGSEGSRFCLHHQHPGRHIKVYALDDTGTHVTSFCSYVRTPCTIGYDGLCTCRGHPGYPLADHVLAYLLMMQGDESKYWDVAVPMHHYDQFNNHDLHTQLVGVSNA